MMKTTIRFTALPSATEALKNKHLKRFPDIWKDKRAMEAVNTSAAMLDRGDVLLTCVVLSKLGLPAIIALLLALKEDRKFAETTSEISRLRKFLGLYLRFRMEDMGLIPTGKKGMLSKWSDTFKMSEIYSITETTARLLNCEQGGQDRVPFFVH